MEQNVGKATVLISDKQVELNIKVNNWGGLVLEGLPRVVYEFYCDELVLMEYKCAF